MATLLSVYLTIFLVVVGCVFLFYMAPVILIYLSPVIAVGLIVFSMLFIGHTFGTLYDVVFTNKPYRPFCRPEACFWEPTFLNTRPNKKENE